jgi:hypothetical protein
MPFVMAVRGGIVGRIELVATNLAASVDDEKIRVALDDGPAARVEHDALEDVD